MAIPGMAAAAAGLKVMQLVTQVHASNVANAKTIGFKPSEVETTDLFYTQLKRSGIFESSDALRRPVGVEVGTGSKVVGIYKLQGQGDPKITNNPLDIMITGPGYFAMSVPTAPNGRTFTRNGAFHIDSTSRKLVNFDGDALLDDISIPANVDVSTVQISREGAVTGFDNTNAQVEIGQLTLWTFPNEEGLSAQGKSQFVETPGSGDGAEIDNLTGKFLSGTLEEAAVSNIVSLTQMIEAQQAYSMITRAISIMSEMAKSTTEIS